MVGGDDSRLYSPAGECQHCTAPESCKEFLRCPLDDPLPGMDFARVAGPEGSAR